MLGTILRPLSLASSLAALICLVMVFVGCTSSSAPENLLYFLKVKLTDLSSINGQISSRSLETSNTDLSDLAGQTINAVSNLSHANLGDSVSNLNKVFAFGLWGYCQGQLDAPDYTYCSAPNASFNLVGVPEISLLAQALPENVAVSLEGLSHTMPWIISVYILSLIATTVAIIMGLLSSVIPWLKVTITVGTMAALIFTVAASISATAIYSLIREVMQVWLHSSGVTASLGPHMLVATWLAFAFSLASAMLWILGGCC